MSRARQGLQRRKRAIRRRKISRPRHKIRVHREIEALPTLQGELARSLASRLTPADTSEEFLAKEIEPTRR